MHFVEPRAGQNVAMAYKSSPGSKGTTTLGQGRAWEELRREARKLEGELDVKLAAYNKLCSGYEANFKLRSDGSSLAADQLSQSKAVEIESLLQRLSDSNDEMSSLLGSAGDSRSHLLARHRDILQDYTLEFRRLNATIGAARDRLQLMAGASDSPSHVSLQVQGSTGALLRERSAVQSATSALDQVLAQATAVSTSLVEQRSFFNNVSDKVLKVGASFPVVNTILNSIRRKKSKDTIILASVIAACTLFTLMYMFFK